MRTSDNHDKKTKRKLQALERAIQKHDRLLVNWLTSKLGDWEVARDIAQSTYLRAWKYAHETHIDNPRALLFKIAANLAANEFAARKKRSLRDFEDSNNSTEDMIDRMPSDAPSPERTWVAKRDAELAIAAINQLPTKIRRAFIMSRFEEKTYDEIAASLSISVSSVEKYIIAALKSLRDSVDRQGNGTRAVVKFSAERSDRGQVGYDDE